MSGFRAHSSIYKQVMVCLVGIRGFGDEGGRNELCSSEIPILKTPHYQCNYYDISPVESHKNRVW